MSEHTLPCLNPSPLHSCSLPYCVYYFDNIFSDGCVCVCRVKFRDWWWAGRLKDKAVFCRNWGTADSGRYRERRQTGTRGDALKEKREGKKWIKSITDLLHTHIRSPTSPKQRQFQSLLSDLKFARELSMVGVENFSLLHFETWVCCFEMPLVSK